jgi:DNA replication and repair protein RecF
MNTLTGSDGFRLQAFFEKDDKEMEVVSIYRGGNKKEILLNGIPYEKFSQHIGVFPVVMIAPDDVELISGGSEGRRKFVDTLISQLNPAYLQELIRYNKVLQQRNSLLKNWNIQPSYDLLDALDHQLVSPGDSIHNIRKQYLNELIPLVKKFYQRIAPGSDKIEISYQSQLSAASQASLLKEGREKDILLQRSNYGIHKDDLILQLQGQPFKSIASQGQRKSMLFSLKLAEYETIHLHKNSCILLLDDVFEKLDEERMKNLMEWVCLENAGQVFITDTHRGRLEQAFSSLGIVAQEILL